MLGNVAKADDEWCALDEFLIHVCDASEDMQAREPPRLSLFFTSLTWTRMSMQCVEMSAMRHIITMPPIRPLSRKANGRPRMPEPTYDLSKLAPVLQALVRAEGRAREGERESAITARFNDTSLSHYDARQSHSDRRQCRRPRAPHCLAPEATPRSRPGAVARVESAAKRNR